MHAFDDRNPAAPGADGAHHDLRRPERLTGVIPSDRLLAGQPCVTIDHEGTHYVLRATRAGKLILTK